MLPPDQQLAERLHRIAMADVEGLLNAQEKYGDSWRCKGGMGAYFTISRKVDRYEHACKAAEWDVFAAIRQNPASDGSMFGKDSLLDDVRDLRRYLLLVEEFATRSQEQL